MGLGDHFTAPTKALLALMAYQGGNLENLIVRH
jgi:hypothetical protein